MPTRYESPAAVGDASPEWLRFLRTRLRQRLRVTLVLVIGLAVAASALAIWWLTSLNGLPDIGDPFRRAQWHRARCLETKNNGHPSARHLHDGRCSRSPLL